MIELVLRLTDRCQLRCKYCYVDKQDKEIPFDILLKVLKDAERTLITKIGLDGGEPFLYSHIEELLYYLSGNPHFKKIVMSTNTLLLPKYIDKLPENIEIQLSIDGRKQVTDYLRGKGVYDSVIKCLELLKETNLTYGLGMVYNQVSKKELPHVIGLALQFGCRFVHVNYQTRDFGEIKKAPLEEYQRDISHYRRIIPPFVLEISSPLSSHSFCYAGCRTFAFTPDLTYVKCTRYPDTIIGRYPELPSEVLKRLKVNYVVRTPCHFGNWEYVKAETVL
ncbi:MAG TPA: radical SAM protein [Thermoplasmatales archaeon]|nr:radical SAM protein [Thermoplasmatales archaeon]